MIGPLAAAGSLEEGITGFDVIRYPEHSVFAWLRPKTPRVTAKATVQAQLRKNDENAAISIDVTHHQQVRNKAFGLLRKRKNFKDLSLATSALVWAAAGG